MSALPVELPVGSPDEVRAGAAALRRAGQATADVQARIGSTAQAVLGAWTSDAARLFGHLASRVGGVADLLATVHGAAAQALEGYADELEDAQRTIRRLIRDVEDAEHTLATSLSRAEQTMREATARTLDATATAVVQEAQDLSRRAHEEFDAVRSDAVRVAAAATGSLRAAADAARRRIEALEDELRSAKLTDIVDVLGGPISAAEVQTLALIGVAGRRTYSVLSALRSANWDDLTRLAPEGLDAVDSAVARYGDDSLEALRAWYGWQSDTASTTLRDLGHAVDGMGSVPRGLAGAFDVAGKVGLGLGAVGDVLTIADGDASTLDRALSGANLVGTGMAAMGTSAAALVGINAVADWVPVVGEVVMGATAAYLAGEWIYHHRAAIGHAAVAAGHAVASATEATGQAVVDAVEWTAKEETRMAQAGLHAAQTVVSGAVHTGEQVASAAEHAAGNAVSTAEKAGSSAWHFVTSHL